MSKLALAITERDTGERKALKPIFKTVNITESIGPLTPSFGGVGHRYDIKAVIGASIYISDFDQMRSGPNTAIQEAITAVRKQVIEEVFGEFRPLITEMRVALYDDDTDRAKDILARLEHQMFVEGL